MSNKPQLKLSLKLANQAVCDCLSPRELLILDYITTHDGITNKQLAEHFHWPARTTSRYLQNLTQQKLLRVCGQSRATIYYLYN